MVPMLSERQYVERIVRLLLEAAIREELASFREGSAHYGIGGELEEQGKGQLRLAPALSSFLNLREGWQRLVAAFLLWVAPMAAMGALPFLVTNSYADSKAWGLLSRQAAGQSPATALMSEYVMRVQPIFAVVGYPMLRVFDPYGLAPPHAGAGGEAGTQETSHDA